MADDETTPVTDDMLVVVWRNQGDLENQLTTHLSTEGGKVVAFKENAVPEGGVRFVKVFGQATALLNGTHQKIAIPVPVARELNPEWEYVAG